MHRNHDVNLLIEKLKVDNEFSTYIETVSYFLENETDQEPEQVAKLLNKKIIEEINQEANSLGMLKVKQEPIAIL